MNVCLLLNAQALYVTAGALVGAPLGYAIGWLTDPAGLVSHCARIFLGVLHVEREFDALNLYMQMRAA